MTWNTEAAWILNTSCQSWTAVLGILELFPFTRCVLSERPLRVTQRAEILETGNRWLGKEEVSGFCLRDRTISSFRNISGKHLFHARMFCQSKGRFPVKIFNQVFKTSCLCECPMIDCRVNIDAIKGKR